MSGRFGHFIPKGDKIKHFAKNPIRRNEYAYGFGGVTFWLDAAFGLNTNTNLGAVTYWKDKIQGISFEQATAGNQPRLIASAADFNNLPVIDFYGQTRNLDAGSLGASINPTTTIAVVYKRKTNATGATHKTSLFGVATSAVTGFSLVLQTSSSNSVGFASVATFEYSSTTPYDTLPHILILNGNNFYDNGVSLTPTGSTFTSSTYGRLSGSANNNSGTLEIAEIICFSSLLDSSECAALSNRLNLKYAIY